MTSGENLLSAALAAGIPLPHSCRAGRCATCKAQLLDGQIVYPDGKLPPGIVESEARRGDVLLCQARAASDLRIRTRVTGGGAAANKMAVLVSGTAPLSTGGQRATLRRVGAASLNARPGQYVDAETADGRRERVAVVALAADALDVELLELAPADIVRIAGPFDSPR